jgi:hypothetical protein
VSCRVGVNHSTDDELNRKNFYGIAISLANSQACDQSFVNDIFQMYGDHLYFKGDYDGAITQYLETIAHTEPSYGNADHHIHHACNQLIN